MRNKRSVPKTQQRRRWRVAIGSVLSVGLTLVGLAFTAAPASAVVVGQCTIKANNPHGSTHVSGTINAQGTLSCTIGMTQIYVQTYLEKQNGPTWVGNAESWLNTPASKTYFSHANTSCNQGPSNFRTRVSYSFQSPPGTNPSYTANTIYSPWISVICGANRAVPADSSGAAATEWTSDVPLQDGITINETNDGIEIVLPAQ